MTSRKVTYTQHHSGIIESKVADSMYEFLRDNVPWVDSVKSRRSNRITRKGWAVPPEPDNLVVQSIENLVNESLNKVCPSESYLLLGTYANFYQSGEDWAPSHSHPGMVQLVISLGATRVLKVGTKNYSLASGDTILFGASAHELMRDPSVIEGRISIATFMKRL